MGRDLTRRRHGRHRRFGRVRRGDDTTGFLVDQAARLLIAGEEKPLHDTMHLVQGEAESFAFEQVQAAALPTDIGLPLGFTSHTDSLLLSGTKFLHDSGSSALSHADTFSVSMWVKPTALTVEMQVFGWIGGGSKNQLLLSWQGNLTNDPMRLFIRDNLAAVRVDNNYDMPSDFTGLWTHFLIVWATGPSPIVYINGVLTAASSTSETAGVAVADPGDRSVWFGSATGGGVSLQGNIHAAASWNADVSSAIADIYNAGVGSTFNLGADSGAYTFSANLMHWWLAGKDSADIGKDTGSGSPLIDIDTAVGGGLSSADIVADAP